MNCKQMSAMMSIMKNTHVVSNNNGFYLFYRDEELVGEAYNGFFNVKIYQYRTDGLVNEYKINRKGKLS